MDILNALHRITNNLDTSETCISRRVFPLFQSRDSRSFRVHIFYLHCVPAYNVQTSVIYSHAFLSEIHVL